MLFRIEPKMLPPSYETYGIHSPQETHTRVATCQEVECKAYANGWHTAVDTNTPLGAKQANYIRLMSGRHFTFTEVLGLVTFTFPAGQQCFTEHRMPLDRPATFYVHGGDYRGRTSDVKVFRPEDWTDKFANHQARLADEVQKG